MSPCRICLAEKCLPNPNLKENMDYFSDITQSTLSAFHKAGLLVLNEEIEPLRDTVHKMRVLTLRDAVPYRAPQFSEAFSEQRGLPSSGESLTSQSSGASAELVQRFYTDGTSDVVPKSQLFEPKVREPGQVQVIRNALAQEPSPISRLGLARYRRDLTCERRPITRASEQIFFAP